jgi:hypothetical protein
LLDRTSGRILPLTNLKSNGSVLCYKDGTELDTSLLQLIAVGPNSEILGYRPQLKTKLLAKNYKLFLDSFFKQVQKREEEVYKFERRKLVSSGNRGFPPTPPPSLGEIMAGLIQDIYKVRVRPAERIK